MDELTLDGKIYLSSKRAAAVTGYAKDYVGQLCREGRVEARLVGRSWYVLEDSIRKHRFSEESVEDKPEINEEKEEKITEITWERPAYRTEEVEMIPPLEEKQPIQEEIIENTPVSSMQEAWQEWFSIKKDEKITDEKVPVSFEDEPVLTKEEYIEEVQEEEKPVEIRIERNRGPIEVHSPVKMDIEPISYKEDPADDFKVEKKTRTVRKQSDIKIKALLIGFVVIVIAITLVGTGILSEKATNLGVLSEIVDFLSGKTTVK